MARQNFEQNMTDHVRSLENTMREVGLINQAEWLTLRLGSNTSGYAHRISIRDSIGGGERTLIEHCVTVKRNEFRAAVLNYHTAIKATRAALTGQKFYL